MNNRISVPAIGNIEFIDLQESDINPLSSSCKVKVFYIGQNRNESYIDKATATKMSKTLRGCPIVGYYVKEKEDFGDHGHQMIIDGNGVEFNKLTRPYGFVPPNAKVWFQFFEDTDEFGNTCLREYLVTECILWTGQFEEAKKALENKNPQSMELVPESMKGHWATDNNSGFEFFIINDAIFSSLCILGEDVEPCFEGSQFFDPEISNFSLDDSFIKEYTKMIREFNNYAFEKNEGGLSMNTEEISNVETEEVENSLQEQDNFEKTDIVENENITEEFKKNDEEEKKEESSDDKPASKENEEDSKENDEDEEKKKKPETNNALVEEEINIEELQNNFTKLQEEFASLKKENDELLAFKKTIEDEKKTALIDSFYMLSDEDKKEVIANKSNYSLEDIEKELSVICVRKKVNFDNNEDDNNEIPPTVFNLNAVQVDDVPAWVKRVEDVNK